MLRQTQRLSLHVETDRETISSYRDRLRERRVGGIDREIDS